MSTPTSAETRLARLLERLLTAAEASLAAGDLEPARATAEEVRAVDPDNERAAEILHRLQSRQLRPAGERALMTLLFSDLVGSTMLSERVEPEQLRDLFAHYRTTAREAMQRYNGDVIQYSGDGILAGFGFPEPHEDDARRAVLAGLDLIVAMQDARADLERRIGFAPEVRVGIHTGRVVITDMSDDPSVAERDSIVGVVPNLAARIQQAAEPGMVVISDVTQQLVDTDFYLHSLGEQDLKGISRPVEVFAVERPRYAGARFESERYRKAGLVGRDHERDQLLKAWRAVRKTSDPGGDSTFLVVGEAGIGKSRLVAEVLDRVEASGGKVLGLGCLPYYTNVSLWPVARMVERAISVVGEDGDHLPALVAHLTSAGLDPARFVPFLGSLIGVAGSEEYPAPELDPSAFLDETLTRLVQWLSALAERTPHLFAVEDLHWADPSTLALLGRLVERAPAGLLTVATTRDASLVPWRDAVSTIELGRLDGAAATRLVENLVSGQDLGGEHRTSIVEQAEGIPLFIEELTRSCLEQRDEPMPLRLQELFTWRLKSPGVDLRVVQAAATVGPTFDAATVSGVIGDEAMVSRQLELLTDEGIIEPGDPAAKTFRFRHALMRDAAYETQVLDVRSENHAKVADSLTGSEAEPALIAEHLDRAGMAERAAYLYLVAAQAQQVHGAHTEATKLLSRALALLETLPESEERDLSELTDRMLRALSVSSMQGYAAPDVQADHRRAEVLASRLDNRPEVLPSLIAIWAYWLTSGDLSTSSGVIDRLMRMVESASFSWFEPEVVSCAGWQEFYEGDFAEARRHLQQSVDGFRARPAEQLVSPFWPLPNDPLAISEIGLACVSSVEGDPAGAERWIQEARQRAEAIGFPRGPFSRAFVGTFAAWIHRYQRDLEGSQRLGAEVVEIGREHGSVYWTTNGFAYLAAMTPGEAPDPGFLEQVIVTLRLMGQGAFAPSNIAFLSRLRAQQGDLHLARDLVNDALELVHKGGEYLHLAELLRIRAGYTLALGGDQAEAVADLTEAVSVATRQGGRVARLRAALDLAQVAPDIRPAQWRTLLAEARADLPDLATEETAAADELLGR